VVLFGVVVTRTSETSAAAKRRRCAVAFTLATFVALAVGVAALVSAPAPAAARAPARIASATSDDWPTPMHDLSRTNASSDTTISPATAGSLKPLWTFNVGSVIVPAPIVTGGVAYFSAWNGYEYAVNAKTGVVLWKTFMGTIAANPICIPPQAGPSTPSVLVNGTILTGGADGYFYALNAQTGAVEWKVWTWGSNPPGFYDGHFNYSPALVVGNYAYIGVASLGDCPLIQGDMLKVDLTTHQVVQTLDFVPTGFVGGGTWTEPAYDPTNGLIYVSTATQNQPNELFAQALAAIDPTTMQIVNVWTLPVAESIGDSDFGTTPTLYTANGVPMLASINKNGIDYGMNRDNLSAGPLWMQYIALGGPCPTCDDGSVSSQAYGGGDLFAAGGRGAINGVISSGTVRALNPATGAFIWQRVAPGDVIGALAYDNGMLLVPAGTIFEVLSAKTGARLYSYDTGSLIYAGVSAADGKFFVSNTAGEMIAFGLPKTKPHTPADRNCPGGFTCQAIGRASPSGHEASCADGACAATAARHGRLTISAGGSGVGGTSDRFRLVSAPTNGTDQVVARVESQPSAAGSQVGTMIRQRSDADSPYYALLEEPGHRLVVEYRTAFAGATSEVYSAVGPRLPLYLMIQRHGDILEAATSRNGRTYTLVPGTDATVPMPAKSLGGVAVSAGAQGRAVSAVVSNLSVGSPTTTPAPSPSAHPCPPGYSCADIGNPSIVGDQQLSGSKWTLSAGGFDIWAISDQFHFVWKSVSGPTASVSAEVTSVSNTSPDTKAGVMLRLGTNPAAAWYAVFVTPGNGIEVEYRSEDGDICAQTVNPAGTAPLYVMVTSNGGLFTAFTSPDGANWTPIGGSAVPLPDLTGSLIGGIALTSHDGDALATASFNSVSIS
jgi:outer membrane protein assembly factor BamB